MFEWLQENYQWVISTLVEIAIAFLIFYLTKKLSIRENLQYKAQVRKELDKHLAEIEDRGINRKMVMINSKLVGKRGEKNSEYYAELKTTRHEGVEFFDSIQESVDSVKIFVVCLLPYEYIEYIDLRGDDSDYLPQIICKFKGIRSTPMTEIRYYKESNVYHEGNDPPDYRFTRLYEIPELKKY